MALMRTDPPHGRAVIVAAGLVLFALGLYLLVAQ
jgi:hypothetical protein